MVFTGTGFLTTGYTANVSFMNISADTVTIDSATKVTAEWTNGLPTTPKAGVKPSLEFKKTGLTVVHKTNVLKEVVNVIVIT